MKTAETISFQPGQTWEAKEMIPGGITELRRSPGLSPSQINWEQCATHYLNEGDRMVFRGTANQLNIKGDFRGGEFLFSPGLGIADRVTNKENYLMPPIDSLLSLVQVTS